MRRKPYAACDCNYDNQIDRLGNCREGIILDMSANTLVNEPST